MFNNHSRRFWWRTEEWQQIFSLLHPQSKIRAELISLLATRQFKRQARCPTWAQWNSSAKACDPSPLPAGRGCPAWRGPRAEAYLGYVDPARERCAANLYRRTNLYKWGGRCTCPDGLVYEVSDNADDCASLACDGGVPVSCSNDGITNPSNRGNAVTCQPDFVGASRLELGIPEADAECWSGRWPRFITPGFARTCPMAKGARIAGTALGFLEGLAILSPRCLTCNNLAPSSARFGDFYIFVAMFSKTPAAELCEKQFGRARPGGPVLNLTRSAHSHPLVGFGHGTKRKHAR